MCIHIRWRSNFILLQVDVAIVWIWIPNPQFKGLVTAWCYGGRDGGKLGDGFMSLSMYPWRTGGSLLLPTLFILVCVVEVGVGMLLVLEVSRFVSPGTSTIICCVISDQKQWGQHHELGTTKALCWNNFPSCSRWLLVTAGYTFFPLQLIEHITLLNDVSVFMPAPSCLL